MATVYDVAKYILEQQGEITAMKLQKLVYYSLAWHLVWEEEALFNEKIEAWANGAVCPDLYKVHKGLFKIDDTKLPVGNSDNLLDNEKESIKRVLDVYGDFSAQQLSDLNHKEAPWINARGELEPMARSDANIDINDIYEFHLGVWEDVGSKEE